MVTLLGGLLAMLTGLLHDLIQLAASPSGLTALAGTVLAGAMLAAVLALIASVASPSQESAAQPLIAGPRRCGRSPGARRSCASAIPTRRAGPGPEHPRRPWRPPSPADPASCQRPLTLLAGPANSRPPPALIP